MRIDVKGPIISSGDDWIYDFFGIEYVSPKKVNEAIAKSNNDKLDVYINSGGGDIFAGSEIYESIRSYSGQVEIHIVGLAASAASVIACAGHSEIAPTAMLMVHNVSSTAQGDYRDMDKSSEVLKKANETIASAYVSKTNMTKAEALELMDKETWLTAQDAVEKGLVDKISEPQNMQLVASYDSGMLPQEVVQKMRDQGNPLADKGKTDIFMQKKAQAQLNLLNLRRI